MKLLSPQEAFQIEDIFKFDTYDWVMVRIRAGLNKEQFGEHLYNEICECNEPYFPRYIVSEELDSSGDSTHLHAVIAGFKNAELKLKDKVKDILKKDLGLKGNKDFSCKVVNTVRQAICYTIKEGNFLSFGFLEKDIETYRKLAYRKFDKAKFAAELQALEIKYKLKYINARTFFDSYVDLRLSFGQGYPGIFQLRYVQKVICEVDANYKQRLNDKTFDTMMDICHTW